MIASLKLPPLHLFGQAFHFAWRMGLFFSPILVAQVADSYSYLVGGRLVFLLAFAVGSMGMFLSSRGMARTLSDKTVIGLGAAAAMAGVLLVITGSVAFAGSMPFCLLGFAIAGLGDACLALAFGKMYSNLSIRLSMQVVPLAMILAAFVYVPLANSAVAVALPVLVLLPLVSGLVLLRDLSCQEALRGDESQKPRVSQEKEPAFIRFTKWKISLLMAVLWLVFGLMWSLAVSRVFEGPGFLGFSLSVAALVAIMSAVLVILTYVLRLPTVKTFWIFAPLAFAGITVAAVVDSSIQILAFALVLAAHNIAEMQLIAHFAAICRRRGDLSGMLYGCGFAILNAGEALGVLAGMAIAPAHSTTLTLLLLLYANAIVTVVIPSIMRVDAAFQKAELETVHAKQEAPQVVDAGSTQNGAPSGGGGCSGPTQTNSPARWVDRYGLSARESEVADLLLSGRNVPAIAELLYISRSTVQTHVKHIYEKVGVRTRQELIAKLSESEE